MTQTATQPAPLDPALFKKALEILDKATIDPEARTVTLPDSFDPHAYPVVREILNRVGGRFDPARQVTQFPINPAPLVAKLIAAPNSFAKWRVRELGPDRFEARTLGGDVLGEVLKAKGWRYKTALERTTKPEFNRRAAFWALGRKLYGIADDHLLILEHENGALEYLDVHNINQPEASANAVQDGVLTEPASEPDLENTVQDAPSVKESRPKRSSGKTNAATNAGQGFAEKPAGDAAAGPENTVSDTNSQGGLKIAAQAEKSPPLENTVLHANLEDRRLIPWHSVVPSPLNPRKRFDPVKLQELAASIEEKGVLQNLIVRPHREGGFEIAAGERRWRAVNWLREQERLTDDYLIPVVVRKLTDRELLEMAVSENVQRADMEPMDEAEGYAALFGMGATAEEIALRVGKSEATVQKRLALANRLAPEVKAALRENRISLAAAQAFTTGSPEAQVRLLKDKHMSFDNPRYIRSQLALKRLHVKHARFKAEAYAGEIVEDLFGDVEPWYADAEQAERLQLEAAEAIREKLGKKWAWARLERGSVGEYSAGSLYVTEGAKSVGYTREKDKSKGGAFVVVDPRTLEVRVFEGWRLPHAQRVAGRKAETSTPGETKKTKAKPDLEKSRIAATLQKHLGTERTVFLTPTALDRVGRVPKREADSSTVAGRVESLAELLRETVLGYVTLDTPRVQRPLERTELIALLEGDGIAHARYTLPLSSPRSIESSQIFDILVKPGELHIGIASWDKPDPDLTLPTHALEITTLADAILSSKARGSSGQFFRALEAVRTHYLAGDLGTWDNAADPEGGEE